MKKIVCGMAVFIVQAAAYMALGEAVPSKSGGVWTFNISSDDTYGGSIASASEIVKEGDGTLTLTGSNGGFSGSFTVNNGILTASSLAGFGNPAAIAVSGDAQFKTPSGSDSGLSNADVTFSGSGPDGSGALYIQCGANKNFFKSTTMTGDAAITVMAQAAVFGSTLNMNGHTLTMKGAGPWKMNMSTVTAGDPADGSRHAKIVSECGLLFQNRCTFNGGAVNKIENGTSDTLNAAFQSSREAIPWTFDGGSGGWNFNPTASTASYTNIVSGAVMKGASSGNFRITNSGGTTMKLSGDVYSATTVENRGAPGSTNWMSGVLTALGGVNDMAGAIVLDGRGRHYLGNSTVSDHWSAGNNTTRASGSLSLLDMGAVTNSVFFRVRSTSADTPCELVISNTTDFVGSGSGSTIHMRPDPNGVNIVDLREGTVLPKCNLLMGVWQGQDSVFGPSIGTNSLNAVYFRGATLATRNASGTQNLYLSNDHESYGYFGMTDGTLSSFALLFGAGYESVGGPSVFHMKGGTLSVPYVSMGRGGRDSVYWQRGGTMTSQYAVMGLCKDGNFTAADGVSVLAFDGNATTASVGRVRSETLRDARLTVALNGGATMAIAGFERYNPVLGVNSEFHFAVNGGVIDKIEGATATFGNMSGEYGTATFTLYDEGLTMNVESNKCLNPAGTEHYPHTLKVGFSNPSGKSLMSVALPSDEAFLSEKYIGAPIVRISDATGMGAAALAEFDEESRRVTGITVVAPGFGFSDSPSVTIASADRRKWYACEATVGFREKNGGFTKTGNGHLGFGNYCSNTYEGATRILGGTLGYGLSSIPTNSAFEIAAGATLALDGVGSIVRRVELKSLSGSGRIVAGVSTNGADPGVRQITVREGLALAGGEPLVTDGAVDWSDGAVLTVQNPGELDMTGEMNVLLRADGGILGNKNALVVQGLTGDHWHVYTSGGVLGVLWRKPGLKIFVR